MGACHVRSGILSKWGLGFASAHREAIRLSGFLMHCAGVLGRGGRGRAKPQFCYQMPLAVRRIHKKLATPMGVLPGAKKVFDAICKAYVVLHGADALLPKRN